MTSTSKSTTLSAVLETLDSDTLRRKLDNAAKHHDLRTAKAIHRELISRKGEKGLLLGRGGNGGYFMLNGY